MSAYPHYSSVSVSLRRLFPSASFVGCADIHAVDATEHSGQCGARTVFAAITGQQFDGQRFVAEAINRGAPALLVDRPLASASVPQCIVPDVRRAYAVLCAALRHCPSRKLSIAGVTGTNGKTTVAWLIRSILQAAGKQTGLLGTIEYHDGASSQPARLTTPDSKSLNQWLGAMVASRTSHAAIELSSHALDQGRAAGTWLDAAVVTNITQDHFDYHNDMQSYKTAKSKIVHQLKSEGVLILNQDDPGSRSLLGHITDSTKRATYALDHPADITAEVIEETLLGTRFTITLPNGSIQTETKLIGRHNVSNCLAAAAVALYGGIAPDKIAAGIRRTGAIPGRLERIDCGQPFDVFVDYAHTDDALRRCVNCLARLARGRVICVFGAGGDRDRSKRPLLGQAAATAHVAVVTSDNPRTEEPDQIISEIVAGMKSSPCRTHIEQDRAAAIEWALAEAKPGDCVLVAGKGHETDQIIGTKQFRFDDREVVRHTLQDKPYITSLPREHVTI